jgi:hypothetical protein
VTVVLANLGTPDQATVPAVRRFLKQFIRDKKQLKYYAKSFFSKYPYGHYLYSLSELDENDKSVIGTEIYLRMPQTCCCRDKDKICLTCLGKLATLVSDIPHGLGDMELKHTRNN